MNPIVAAFGEHQHADHALRWAAELAAATGAPLHVVSVYEPTYSEIAPDWFDQLVAERRSKINSALAEIGHADPEITAIKSGEPFDAIAKYLASHDAAFCVVGADGHHARGGLGAGHPGQYLLHHTHVPVVTVSPDFEPLSGGIIVVGVDGSGANAEVVRDAERLAAATNGELHAVFAYDPIDETFSLPEGWHRHSDEVRAEVAKVTSVPIKLYMAAGHPSEVLIEHAQRARAAAVMIGTRGRGGFNGLILGRVAGQLLAHARCPLIVRPA